MGLDWGYELSHKLVGSVVAIIGFALTCLVFNKIIGGEPAGKMLPDESSHAQVLGAHLGIRARTLNSPLCG
jgi:hypothetical protein